MEQKLLQSSIFSARQTCEASGKKLTEKRQRVLEVLLKAEGPMSAYELTDAYNQVMEIPIMAMSVYRILDFLESTGLVHRLHSVNKYMVCKSASGSYLHRSYVFLICKSCQYIEELDTPQNVIAPLLQQAEKSGFSPAGAQLELTGLCNQCKQLNYSNHEDY